MRLATIKRCGECPYACWKRTGDEYRSRVHCGNDEYPLTDTRVSEDSLPDHCPLPESTEYYSALDALFDITRDLEPEQGCKCSRCRAIRLGHSLQEEDKRVSQWLEEEGPGLHRVLLAAADAIVEHVDSKALPIRARVALADVVGMASELRDVLKEAAP